MNTLIRQFAALFLAVVTFAGMVSAQEMRAVKAHIPFEFTVGNKTFPAGDYSITQPTQRVLAVRDDRGHMIATVFVHDVESRGPMSTLLRFKLVDGQYSLAEVWSQDGSSTGQQLAQAKPRVDLAQSRTVDTDRVSAGSQ